MKILFFYQSSDPLYMRDFICTVWRLCEICIVNEVVVCETDWSMEKSVYIYINTYSNILDSCSDLVCLKV